jgi:hypothetical protein
MTRCVVAAAAPLWLLVAGCVEEQRTRLVSPNGVSEPVVARSLSRTGVAPATEAAARRVVAVGAAVVVANPQLGLRPVFITTGAPQLEIFHKGTGALGGCQVVLSEGLVRRCSGDAQLAAVICWELGKVIVERESLAGRDQRRGESRPIIEAPIDHDSSAAFGPADGTLLMEAGKREKPRRKATDPPLLPSADLLAEQYLKRAGYAATDLDQVRPLLREAEGNCILEKNWKAVALPGPALKPPPAASPPP